MRARRARASGASTREETGRPVSGRSARRAGSAGVFLTPSGTAPHREPRREKASAETARPACAEHARAERAPKLLRDAVGVEDARDRADRLEDGVEVLGLGHLEG